MYPSCRSLFAVAVLLVWVVQSPPARAWVETTVKSDSVTLDVERDLATTVTHEILLQIRGGPLKSWDLAGVDADAEPLPDCSASRAQSGGAAGSPIPLVLAQRDHGTLTLEVDNPKGLSRGTYQLRVRYRTHLGQRGLVSRRGDAVEVRWIGPRLPDGVDGAEVVFRIPPAPTAPAGVNSGDPSQTYPHEALGVFLSNLRRASDKDELELVRPHVAKGEPVVWRIEVDPHALDAFAPVATAAPFPPSDRIATRPWDELGVWLVGGSFVALSYGALVLLKWGSLRKAGTLRETQSAPLVPLPVVPRALLAGMLLAAAGAVAKLGESPTLSGLLLLASMALAAHRTPSIRTPLRGPGRWLPLTDQEAFRPARVSVPGRWLDAGTWRGFAVFGCLLGACAALAGWLLSRSAYDAAFVALASANLFPIFLTGRTGELAADPVWRGNRLFQRLANELRRRNECKVAAWARLPEQSGEPDELRLLVIPAVPRAGLLAIEIGLEQNSDLASAVPLPCLLLRVSDGSSAQRGLGRLVEWSRGRQSQERVAFLRPKLPTFELTLALVKHIVVLMTEVPSRQSAATQPPTSAAMAGGKAASAAKPTTAVSPPQAT